MQLATRVKPLRPTDEAESGVEVKVSVVFDHHGGPRLMELAVDGQPQGTVFGALPETQL